MDIKLVNGSGFCSGVKRAVNLALHAAASEGRKVVTLGPLVHNPLIIKMLEAKGIIPLEEITGDVDVVIIRAHGITKSQRETLCKGQVEIIDATCPLVSRSQRYAMLLKNEGYQVIILGEREHPEIKAVRSYAGDHAIVVESVDNLPDSLGPRVGILAQTTQTEDAFLRLVQCVLPKVKEVKVINTICGSTAARLAETERLARNVQIMIIVGGRQSHNTLELARVSRLAGVETHHIEHVDELQVQWFKNCLNVGIAAGASTPNWLIDEVINSIKVLEKFELGMVQNTD